MNGIERTQNLGTLVLGATSILDPAYCQEVAGHIADRYRFERDTPTELRCFANGLRQLADAVDEQAVLVAEALAEIECAEPETKKTKGDDLMDFQPKYAHCSRCRTSYAPRMVGPLCPQCSIPFSSVIGTVEGGTQLCPLHPVPEINESQHDLVLRIPRELKEAFVTFLEVGLASITVHIEELENDELQLIELLQSAISRLECAEPTPEEVLRRGRALLRGDGEDIEGL